MAGAGATATAILLLIFLPTIILLAYLLHASTASLRSLNEIQEHELWELRYHHHLHDHHRYHPNEYRRYLEIAQAEEQLHRRQYEHQRLVNSWLDVQRRRKRQKDEELRELRRETDSPRDSHLLNDDEAWWKAYGLKFDPDGAEMTDTENVAISAARSANTKCASCAPPPPVSWDEVLPPPQPRLILPKSTPVLLFALAPLPPDDQNAFSFYDKLPTSDASLLATYSLLLHCLPLPATRELLMPPQWQQTYFNCIQSELNQGIDRHSCDRCERIVPSTMQRAARHWCSAQQLYRSEAFARLSNRTMYAADLFPTLPVFRQSPAYLRSVLDLSAPAYLKLDFSDFHPPRVQVSGEWSRITDPMAVMIEKLLELFRFTPLVNEERFSWKQFRRQGSFELLPRWMQKLVLGGNKFSITLRAEKYLFAPLPLPTIIVDEVINKMFQNPRTDCSIWAPNDPHCRWEEFFHPEHGSLRSRLTGLLLVDGFSFDLRTDARAIESFSIEDIQALKSLRVGDLFLDLMREYQSYTSHIASRSNWGRIWKHGELKRTKQKAKQNAKEQMWHKDFDFDFEEDSEMELIEPFAHGDDCCSRADHHSSSLVGVFKLKVPRGKPFLLANLFDHVLHEDGLVVVNRTCETNLSPSPIPMQIHLFSGHAQRREEPQSHDTILNTATTASASTVHEDHVAASATTPPPQHDAVDPTRKVATPPSAPDTSHHPALDDPAALSQFAYAHSDSHSAESHSSSLSTESSPHHSSMHSKVESHESQEEHDDAVWLQSILTN